MKGQPTFSDIESATHKRTAKRDTFPYEIPQDGPESKRLRKRISFPSA